MFGLYGGLVVWVGVAFRGLGCGCFPVALTWCILYLVALLFLFVILWCCNTLFCFLLWFLDLIYGMACFRVVGGFVGLVC